MDYKYIVYRSPYEVPRVTTAEFADQINESQIIYRVPTLALAKICVSNWYYEAAEFYCNIDQEGFKADMGLSS